jgi:hypothetical protein
MFKCTVSTIPAPPTLNTDFPLLPAVFLGYLLGEKSPGKLTLGSCKNRRKGNIKNVSTRSQMDLTG